MSDLKVWKVFSAGRYVEGVLQESIDQRHMSQGQPMMVALEDYAALSTKLAALTTYLSDHHGIDADEWLAKLEPATCADCGALIEKLWISSHWCPGRVVKK